MLEVPILDNTERLLALSPYLDPRSTALTLMHMDNGGGVGSYGGPKYAGLGYNTWSLYNDVLDFFLFAGADSSGIYRLVPENHMNGSLVPVALDTSMILECLTTEPSATGRVWALRRNSSGADGLYRRDASVTVPNWTKVIAAANASNLTLWKTIGGALWYHDATAGNWYQIQNGTAGAVQTTVPAGLVVPYDAVNVPWCEISDGIGESQYGHGLFSLNSPNLIQGSMPITMTDNLDLTSAETATSNWFSIFSNENASGTPAGFRAMIPFETLIYSRFANSYSWANAYWRMIRLDGTYSLFAITNTYGNVPYNGTGITSRRLSGENVPTKISMALLNRSTWTMRHLGVAGIPSLVENFADSASPAYSQPCLFAARKKSTFIDLYLGGNLASATGYTSATGLLRLQVPFAKPIDF